MPPKTPSFLTSPEKTRDLLLVGRCRDQDRARNDTTYCGSRVSFTGRVGDGVRDAEVVAGGC